MRPEDAFTKKSLKRYKRLRRIIKDLETPEGFIIFPGRRRHPEDALNNVYIYVCNKKDAGMLSFSFDSMPTKHQVRQVINLLVELLS